MINMRFFDVIRTKEADPALAKRLGFSKVFIAGEDIDVLDNLKFNGKRKAIVRSKNVGILMRALKENGVIGVMVDDNLLIGKVIAAAKESDKPIVLSTEGLNSRNYPERLRAVYRLRKVYKILAKTKNDVILITLAADRQSLLSTSQMIEISKFIGADDAKSRRMISELGSYNVA
jgi:hypothetical protein